MTIKKKKNLTKTSTRELKYWLSGILEFQPVDWIPSKEQWKTIREKIFSLEDDEYISNNSREKTYMDSIPKHHIQESLSLSDNEGGAENSFLSSFPQMDVSEQTKRIQHLQDTGGNTGIPKAIKNAASFE